MVEGTVSPGFRLSLGANIALMGVIASLWWHGRPAGPAPVPISPPKATARSAAKAATVASDQLRPRANGPQLTPAAVAELERMGISRAAIADALIDDHTSRHDKRVRDLERKYAPKPVPRRELIAVSRQDEADRVRELKAALGEDGYRAWDKEKTLGMLNMGGARLDAAESEKAYQLEKDFEEKSRALELAKEDGVTDEADAQALYDQAQRQLDQDLEKLVGKDRLAQMRGRPDPIADVTRRYQDLNPTPQQATAVLQAEADLHAGEAALVQRLKDLPPNAVNLNAELKAMTDARDENLRQIFGADSYDAVKRQNDSTYQKLQQYAGAWDIPQTQLQPVYATLNALHDEADRTRMAAEMSEAAGQPVNWHQINAGIEQARAQAELKLATMIGGERVRRLQQNGLLDVR